MKGSEMVVDGARLKSFLATRSLTQRDLARAAAWSPSVVSCVIAGDPLGPKRATVLAAALRKLGLTDREIRQLGLTLSEKVAV
jgi:hypothetical protein